MERYVATLLENVMAYFENEANYIKNISFAGEI